MDDHCPVQVIFNYIMRRGDNKSGPLFKRQDGSLMMKPFFIKLVREALATIGYHDESDSAIKTLGRWENVAYLMYMCIPREELKGVPQELAKFGKNGNK